jgi:hypothetical protein
LGNSPLSSCPAADVNRDRAVVINELILAVHAAQGSCEDTCAQGNRQCDPGSQMLADSCGPCGQQQFQCDSACRWKATGVCVGAGECVPGTTREVGCTCGMAVESCNNCQWGPPGTCNSQGECTQGQVQQVACGGHPANQKSRMCSAQCSWPNFGFCGCPNVAAQMNVCQPCSVAYPHFHVSGYSGSCNALSPAQICSPDCGPSFNMCTGYTNQCPSGYHQPPPPQDMAFFTVGCHYFGSSDTSGNTITCILN